MTFADPWPIPSRKVLYKGSAVVIGQLSYSFKICTPQNLQSDWCCRNSAAISDWNHRNSVTIPDWHRKNCATISDQCSRNCATISHWRRRNSAAISDWSCRNSVFRPRLIRVWSRRRSDTKSFRYKSMQYKLKSFRDSIKVD